MGPQFISGALFLSTLLHFAQGQSSENALQTMENYVTNGQAFIKLKGKHIRLYESPDAELLEALPILYWLGPPKVLRDDVNGSDSKILNVVAHALQYDSDHSLNSSLAQGATITGQGTFTVLGFSATWNGDTGYSYVLADFDDHTQATFSDKLAFADANGDYHMPGNMWETSDGHGTGGFTDSGFFCWQPETDPLVVDMKASMGLVEGTPLSTDKFEDQYKLVWEQKHVAMNSTTTETESPAETSAGFTSGVPTAALALVVTALLALLGISYGPITSN